MPPVAHVTRSLFPKEASRPAPRRSATGSRLSHAFAIACALVPLGAVMHAWAVTI